MTYKNLINYHFFGGRGFNFDVAAVYLSIYNISLKEEWNGISSCDKSVHEYMLVTAT